MIDRVVHMNAMAPFKLDVHSPPLVLCLLSRMSYFFVLSRIKFWFIIFPRYSFHPDVFLRVLCFTGFFFYQGFLTYLMMRTHLHQIKRIEMSHLSSEFFPPDRNTTPLCDHVTMTMWFCWYAAIIISFKPLLNIFIFSVVLRRILQKILHSLPIFQN